MAFVFKFCAIFSLFFSLLINEAPSEIIDHPLPNEYNVTMEGWLNREFKITTDQKEVLLGKIIDHRSFFVCVNPESKQMAKMVNFFYGNYWLFDVLDEKDLYISSIYGKTYYLKPYYEIYSKEGVVVAKVNFSTTGKEMKIQDFVTDEILVIGSRPVFYTDWTIKILNRERFDELGLDPRTIFFILAIQENNICSNFE